MGRAGGKFEKEKKGKVEWNRLKERRNERKG